MSKTKRKHIPNDIQKELQNEAGYRCAIPTCRCNGPLEFAHILPVAEGGENEFTNIIVLCSNCYSRYHKNHEKFLNGRYGSFEIRLLEHFMDNPSITNLPLYGRELDVRYLVKDGLIEDDGKRYMNAINFPPKFYSLTDKGKKFIGQWKACLSLDAKIKKTKKAI